MYEAWLETAIAEYGFVVGALNYIFTNDNDMAVMNMKYLAHDTLTDIITFDYSEGNVLAGDVFISTDRVVENAKHYEVDEKEEMRRVMAHGVLHLMGFNDKSTEEKSQMKMMENKFIKMFHVEQ